MAIDEQGRPEPPFSADEFNTLTGFLDYQRATFEWKTRGLDEEQLRHSLPTSAMTLGGMMAHLAFDEDFWIALTVDGDTPEPWASTDWDADPDADWHLGTTASASELRDLWEESVRRSRAVVARAAEAVGTAAALDGTHSAWGGAEHPALRWILTHLIEEYARHNGHADLLREAIDGETGE